MEIINCKKKKIKKNKKMAPLTHEENDFYNKQEICYVCKEMFCMDKIDKNYINKKRLKIIAIILENLEELPIVNAI